MPNLDEIMKMAQDAQAKLMKAQDELDKVEVEGVVGRRAWSRSAPSAKGRILASTSTRACLQPSEKQMVEDLVAAAINDARAKADRRRARSDAQVTSGMAAAAGLQDAVLTLSMSHLDADRGERRFRARSGSVTASVSSSPAARLHRLGLQRRRIDDHRAACDRRRRTRHRCRRSTRPLGAGLGTALRRPYDLAVGLRPGARVPASASARLRRHPHAVAAQAGVEPVALDDADPRRDRIAVAAGEAARAMAARFLGSGSTAAIRAASAASGWTRPGRNNAARRH